MGTRRHHTYDTFGIVRERKWSTHDEVNGQVARASFLLHAQQPEVGSFNSDLFVRFEPNYDGVLRSMVDGRKSNKLFKHSVSRVLSLIM